MAFVAMSLVFGKDTTNNNWNPCISIFIAGVMFAIACMQMYRYPFWRILGDVHQRIVHVGLFEEFVNSLVNG